MNIEIAEGKEMEIFVASNYRFRLNGSEKIKADDRAIVIEYATGESHLIPWTSVTWIWVGEAKNDLLHR